MDKINAIYSKVYFYIALFIVFFSLFLHAVYIFMIFAITVVFQN